MTVSRSRIDTMGGKQVKRLGMTLAELVVVLAILVATAGLVVPLLSGVKADARYSTTRAACKRSRMPSRPMG